MWKRGEQSEKRRNKSAREKEREQKEVEKGKQRDKIRYEEKN